MNSTLDVDIVGVGFGPSNLALAVALQERYPGLRALFLESRGESTWQPGMMLDGSDIQNNPVRDLVTPVNPRSRFSFINYLHETGRLFPYLNLGLHYPLRKEYLAYIRWVADHVDADVRYGVRVGSVAQDEKNPALAVVRTDDLTEIRAPVVVVAPGRTPFVPEVFEDRPHPAVHHFTRYLDALPTLAGIQQPSVAVIGGSQSAVEILLDLRKRLPEARLHGISRRFGYRQKDTSPFMDEVYFPEFIDYYYAASEESKRQLGQELRFTNYAAADIDVVHQLYLQLHEDRLSGEERMRIHASSEVVECADASGRVRLALCERHTAERSVVDADLVILATGFRDLGTEAQAGHEFLPRVLDDICGVVARTPSGRAHISRDYRLMPRQQSERFPGVYLNGLCETSHGMGDAGSFSLLAIRAEEIASSIDQLIA